MADTARSFTQVFVQIWEYVEPSLINTDTSAREGFLHRATEALTALTKAERTFIAAAQSVLDDDGTAPGPASEHRQTRPVASPRRKIAGACRTARGIMGHAPG